MSDVSSIITSVRYLVEDYSRNQIPGDLYTYGSSTTFTLSETNVISITSVLLNDSALTSSQYSFNSTNNKITITASMVSGDTVEVQYSYYANFSDSELESYVRAAVVQISANGYKTWEIDVSDNFYPDPEESEKNLVAVIASLLINKPIVALRLPDISITYPKELSISDKISKTIAVAKSNEAGVGVFSIIGTLYEDPRNY